MADDASDAPGSSDAAAAPAHIGADGALLPAKLPHAELSARVLAAIRDRGTNQTQLCAALSLAPANFSLWKNDKHFRVKELYSAALERWLENPQLEIDDPGLTGTVPHQVPPRNTALGARPKRERPPPAPPPPAPRPAPPAAGRGRRRRRRRRAQPPRRRVDKHAAPPSPLPTADADADAEPVPPAEPPEAAALRVLREVLKRDDDGDGLLGAGDGDGDGDGALPAGAPPAPPPPSSLAAMVRRLEAHGYASAAHLLHDLSALGATAARRRPERAAAVEVAVSRGRRSSLTRSASPTARSPSAIGRRRGGRGGGGAPS